ncbi:Hpt domain-containing protein [Thiofilum flexile]|uniref:Hpt domain-containing protein n=1 Tax=Thiofilum flexile TaxID=125627 RepID=UPI000367FB11|nr:Hpt domain-containing protein [Thiofilum flexile]
MLKNIEQITGINIDKGLKNIGYSESVYLELLCSFFNSCKDYHQRITLANQAGDTIQIKRILHQLYGVAELLGVEIVSNDCTFLLALPQATECSNSIISKKLDHLLQCLEDLFNQYLSRAVP